MKPLGDPGRNPCALAAYQCLAAIPGVVPILHCGSGCGLRAFENLVSANGYQGAGFWDGVNVPCDNIHRDALIMGSSAPLRQLISSAVDQFPASLYVVLTGCNVEMTGEDIQPVLEDFRRRAIPLVAVSTPGFSGNAYKGFELICKTLAKHLAGAGRAKKKGRVNLWGPVPYLDPFWAGNLRFLGTLAEALGLEVNYPFGPRATLNSWTSLGESEANILVSPWVGLDLVRQLQHDHGQPCLHLPFFPVGLGASLSFLEELAAFFPGLEPGSRELIKGFEASVDGGRQRIEQLLSRFDPRFPGHFVVAADAQTGLALHRFLAGEWGMDTTLIITDGTPLGHQEPIRRLLHPHPVVFTEDGEEIRHRVDEVSENPLFFLASSLEKKHLRDPRDFFLEVARPLGERLVLNRTYGGPEGGLTLAEDVFDRIYSPGRSPWGKKPRKMRA